MRFTSDAPFQVNGLGQYSVATILSIAIAFFVYSLLIQLRKEWRISLPKREHY